MNIENNQENFSGKENIDEEKMIELNKIFIEKLREDPMYYALQETQGFFKMMEKKYPPQELQRCHLWHVVALSTPNGTETAFDMPEGEIEDFIRSLALDDNK